MNLSLTREVPVARALLCGVHKHVLPRSSRHVLARATETERDVQERAAAEIDDAKPSGIGQPGGNGNPSIEGLDAETEEKGKRLAKEVSSALGGDAGTLGPEQQAQLANLYNFLVQNPQAKINFEKLTSPRELQAVLDSYQVLLWRPAEILNGRMAMLGFTIGVGNQLFTHQSIWQQLYFNPYAYFFAYLLVTLGSVLNRAYGSPQQGIGPFTKTAELINGRAAMVGYSIIAYIEYRQELYQAAALMFRQLQQQGGGGGIGV
ncbi:hypothetical protein WJX74_003711 [Apatococcus lobatus]|uniref:Uncharacterized protein n=1 Tax=Apatococcus lobatus TaxID=904363 RepID=A0AAW1Q813_9CHLO